MVTRRRVVAAITLLVVAALVAADLTVAEPFRIPSGSMLPTLQAGDSVLVDKLAYGDSGMPKRDDLVVFHEPKTGDILLKRVVGIAGDKVALEDGVLVVNGRHLHEAYADPKKIDSVYFGPVRVPPKSFFAMGDNRADSKDSRNFGSVATSALIGRVIARVWPPARWGRPR